MRSSLRHPIAERRREADARKRPRLRGRARRQTDNEGSTDSAPPPIADLRVAEESGEIVASRAIEAEVRRVRDAGGPLDEAVYTCSCGYCFNASVSTTVPCPHCGAQQAW